MHFDWQDIAAISLVIAAGIHLIRLFWPRGGQRNRRKRPACATCFATVRRCGCAADAPSPALRSARNRATRNYEAPATPLDSDRESHVD